MSNVALLEHALITGLPLPEIIFNHKEDDVNDASPLNESVGSNELMDDVEEPQEVSEETPVGDDVKDVSDKSPSPVPGPSNASNVNTRVPDSNVNVTLEELSCGAQATPSTSRKRTLAELLRVIKCPVGNCHVTFDSKERLRTHISEEHQILIEEGPPAKRSKPSSPNTNAAALTRCPLCPKEFVNKYATKRHIVSAHHKSWEEAGTFQIATTKKNCPRCKTAVGNVSKHLKHCKVLLQELPVTSAEPPRTGPVTCSPGAERIKAAFPAYLKLMGPKSPKVQKDYVSQTIKMLVWFESSILNFCADKLLEAIENNTLLPSVTRFFEVERQLSVQAKCCKSYKYLCRFLSKEVNFVREGLKKIIL